MNVYFELESDMCVYVETSTRWRRKQFACISAEDRLWLFSSSMRLDCFVFVALLCISSFFVHRTNTAWVEKWNRHSVRSYDRKKQKKIFCLHICRSSSAISLLLSPDYNRVPLFIFTLNFQLLVWNRKSEIGVYVETEPYIYVCCQNRIYKSYFLMPIRIIFWLNKLKAENAT